jgi:hypothetical protein
VRLGGVELPLRLAAPTMPSPGVRDVLQRIGLRLDAPQLARWVLYSPGIVVLRLHGISLVHARPTAPDPKIVQSAYAQCTDNVLGFRWLKPAKRIIPPGSSMRSRIRRRVLTPSDDSE